MIGGFEEPTEGQILLYGKDVVGVPPNHRDVNMVFQSYALFPHMSVFDNVAFGLRRKSVDRAEMVTRVNEMLELVQLEGKSDRRPRELSGGQQQRVALARALVNRPRALLLDEPLAALDLKLRQAMQLELKRIQREVGITFIFVTHDQNEALTMSDRLVVMNAGKIEQLGSPREIYERPRTRFVAGFIGTSNLITGTVRQMDGSTAVLDTGTPDEKLVVADARQADARVGRRCTSPCGRRRSASPSRRRSPARCAIRGRVAEVVYLGTSTQYAIRTGDGTELLVFVQNSSDSEDIAAARPGGLAVVAARALARDRRRRERLRRPGRGGGLMSDFVDITPDLLRGLTQPRTTQARAGGACCSSAGSASSVSAWPAAASPDPRAAAARSAGRPGATRSRSSGRSRSWPSSSTSRTGRSTSTWARAAITPRSTSSPARPGSRSSYKEDIQDDRLVLRQDRAGVEGRAEHRAST